MRGKILEGAVLKKSMDKTVVVNVERTKKIMPYGKYLRVRKKYLAHTLDETLAAGDRVLIRSSRPISKRKHWVVISKIEH